MPSPLFVGGLWVWMSGSSGSPKYCRHKVFPVRGCTPTEITVNAAMRPAAWQQRHRSVSHSFIQWPVWGRGLAACVKDRRYCGRSKEGSEPITSLRLGRLGQSTTLAANNVESAVAGTLPVRTLAWIFAAAGRFFDANQREAVVEAIHLLRIDGMHLEAALDQRLDHRPVRDLDGDHDLGRRHSAARRRQLGGHGDQPFAAALEYPLADLSAAGVCEEYMVAFRRPVDASIPLLWIRNDFSLFAHVSHRNLRQSLASRARFV